MKYYLTFLPVCICGLFAWAQSASAVSPWELLIEDIGSPDSPAYLAPGNLKGEQLIERCNRTLRFIEWGSNAFRKPKEETQWDDEDFLSVYANMKLHASIMRNQALPALKELASEAQLGIVANELVQEIEAISLPTEGRILEYLVRTEVQYIPLSEGYTSSLGSAEQWSRDLVGVSWDSSYTEGSAFYKVLGDFPMEVSNSFEGRTRLFLDAGQSIEDSKDHWTVSSFRRSGSLSVSKNWVESLIPNEAFLDNPEAFWSRIKEPELRKFFAGATELFNRDAGELNQLIQQRPEDFEGLLAGLTSASATGLFSDKEDFSELWKNSVAASKLLIESKQEHLTLPGTDPTGQLVGFFETPNVGEYKFDVQLKSNTSLGQLRFLGVEKSGPGATELYFSEVDGIKKMALTPDQIEGVQLKEK